MNRLISTLLIITLCSCGEHMSVSNLFGKKTNTTAEAIDYNQVDTFPTFASCGENLNHQESKICFENTLHQKISQRVKNLKLTTEQNIQDTLLIRFSINKQGVFSCLEIQISDSLKTMLPQLSVEVQEIINGLASIDPAKKRGIPVTSNYTIPVVIDAQ